MQHALDIEVLHTRNRAPGRSEAHRVLMSRGHLTYKFVGELRGENLGRGDFRLVYI
jgi:hypothetical protein